MALCFLAQVGLCGIFFGNYNYNCLGAFGRRISSPWISQSSPFTSVELVWMIWLADAELVMTSIIEYHDLHNMLEKIIRHWKEWYLSQYWSFLDLAKKKGSQRAKCVQKYQTTIVKYPQFYDFSITPIDLSKSFCEKKYVHAFPDRISRMCPERLGGRTPLECGKSPRSKIVNIPSVLKGCEKKNVLKRYALTQIWDTRSITWNIKPCKENILLWFDVFLLIRASFSPPIVSQIELKLTHGGISD